MTCRANIRLADIRRFTIREAADIACGDIRPTVTRAPRRRVVMPQPGDFGRGVIVQPLGAMMAA